MKYRGVKINRVKYQGVIGYKDEFSNDILSLKDIKKSIDWLCMIANNKKQANKNKP